MCIKPVYFTPYSYTILYVNYTPPPNKAGSGEGRRPLWKLTMPGNVLGEWDYIAVTNTDQKISAIMNIPYCLVGEDNK